MHTVVSLPLASEPTPEHNKILNINDSQREAPKTRKEIESKSILTSILINN
jgi:hypothetical protein